MWTGSILEKGLLWSLKDWRSRIFLNDVPTVEVDFKGMHVAILSLEQGKELQGDPYELPVGVLPGTPPELQRSMLKKLLLTAINAKDRNSAFRSFRDGYGAGHLAKSLTNEELSAFLGAFTAKHPHLAGALCSGQGIRLMNVDARIAERVIHRFTQAGIPLLCIHDSFIVPYDRADILKATMRQTARVVVGAELAVEASGVGLDELQDRPLYVQQDYILWRQTPRCAGYLSRLQEHEERWG